MLAPFFPLILIPIPYYFLFHVFFLPFTEDKKQSFKVPDNNIVHCDMIHFIWHGNVCSWKDYHKI